MHTLIFDTTASSCSIVLLSDRQITSKFCQQLDFGQAEVLLPEIKKILQSSGLTFNDIDGVFVCVGPGSFTGVRASISAAKVFGIAHPNLIISGFSSFDAYLSSLDSSSVADCNAVILETRRDDFYVRFYNQNLNPLSEPQALTKEDIITYLKSYGTAVTLVGDGIERFLNQPSGLTFKSIKMFDFIPHDLLAAVTLKQLSEKRFNFPKPLYIRPADVTLPTR